MKGSKRARRVVVSADGAGVVSHAGVGLLREMAEYTGLVDGVTGALIDTYKGVPVHAPGRVFTDLAVAVADGADAISGIAVLTDRQDLFGPVASMPTTWRLLDRIDCRASRRGPGGSGGGPGGGVGRRCRPGPGRRSCVWTSTPRSSIAHSEKENAAATWKKTFGFHPLLCFLDRPDIAGGEALAGLLREGNAGSNTAADHITVLDMALAALPEQARPCRGEQPGQWHGPRLLARSDSAGATHAFAEACVARGVEFSFGFPVDTRIQRIVDIIPARCWHPAIQTDGELRDGAWVAEATGMIDLSGWPDGARLILRKERPHPGAQLSFTDIDGHARHRDPDQHCARDRARSGRRTGAAPPPARPGRGPDPGSQGHRVAQLPLPGLQRERRLARGRADRGRPGRLDQADRLRRAFPNWPAARSPRSATGSCTSPPDSPTAPAACTCASTKPGAGRPTSPKASTDSVPRSPDQPGPRPTDQDPRRTATRRESRTPSDPRTSPSPHPTPRPQMSDSRAAA